MSKKWEIVKRDRIFYVTSMLMCLLCCFKTFMGDDVGSMRVSDGTVMECWEKTIEFYHIWSSRVLINFVVFMLTSKSPIFWAVYMGGCLFILQKAFSCLFLKQDANIEKNNLIISALVLSFPFVDIAETGWIATSCTYFGPIAVGFMSLVPVKKVMENERMKGWEYPVYICCLIYGANSEQMSVVILSVYLVAMIVCLLDKRIKVFLGIMLLLAVGSLVFTLTCPGNYVRTECEILGHNPMYGTLNFINKLDLGLSTTLYELLFKNKWYVLLACIIFTILIFEKYKDNFFRFISCIPVVVVSIMGIFRETAIRLFPSLEVLANEISSNGLVNAENSGGGGGI